MKIFKIPVSLICTPALILTLLFVLLLNPACAGSKEETTQPKEYTQQTAEIVSRMSSGMISPDGEISVTFVNNEIKPDQTGSTIKTKIFHFTPSIDGITQWKNQRTLIFKPNQPLPFRKSFNVEVKYNDLLPKYKNNEPLTFTFTTTGREIADISGDFELKSPTKPENIFYKGTISFTESISIDKVKQAVSFNTQSGTLPLQWQEKEKDKSFIFTTDTITRSNNTQKFSVSVDKDTVDISGDFKKEITLDPIQQMKIKGIRKFDQGKNPGLEIVFTDPLASDQDISGLIRLEPNVNFVFKSVGKSVFLSGKFTSGQTYTLKASGIRSKWGTTMEGETKKQVDFEDQKPQISFLQDGLFLPSPNQQKIGFKTMNVKHVKLTVKKVFESNLGQFLQGQDINANKTRSEQYYDYDVRRVGVKVAEKEITIGTEKNRWINQLLDLQKLVKADEKGIFLITLSFQKKDMLYSRLDKKQKYYYGEEYYSNPNSHGYIYRHGTVVKPVIISDIGMTYKRGQKEHLVFVTNLVDAAPMSGAVVTLRTYQNQIAGKATTDDKGIARFTEVKDKVFYVEAEKDNRRSMIKPAEMGWNLSTFETGGVEVLPEETRAFIYTERGVYRPGDPINLSVIARNNDNTFPDNHPVTLNLYNPRNQLILKKTVNKAKDGFYSFAFKTKPDDLTGNWKAKILVGSLTFYHKLKIETVVPNRLKVKILPKKEKLMPAVHAGDKAIAFDLQSNYLFGAPAAGLKAEVDITVKHRQRLFPKYHGFIFTDESLTYKSVSADVYNRPLDSSGLAHINWTLPRLTNVPSAATAVIKAKVLDKGGRATHGGHTVDIEPYKQYVGLEKPKFRYGYGQVGSPLEIPALLVNLEGKPVAGKQLSYKIYKNSRYWWWEYRSRTNFRLRYKQDKHTRLVKEGQIVSQNTPRAIAFQPEDTGEYLIEVSDATTGGHTAGFFFSAYFWGDAPSGVQSAGTITLKSDKNKYKPGETAIIAFPEPPNGTIFVTVEKGHRVLESYVYDCKGATKEGSGKPGEEGSERRVEIPVTEEMLPNAYISVSIIQPHNCTLNDRPLRVYGVIPLMVEEPKTRQGISIQMPDQLESNQTFEITVATSDKQPTQFTIAVVDEGLLDLTHFPTPDPWKDFFKKQKLGIGTYDLFSFVIGANKGDITRLISIGGDFDSYGKSQMEPAKVQRFKPVSMFKGPLMTDENGTAKLTFTMPNYIGSVKVMVATASGNRYGSSEKAVPVKTDLMVLPTLPRVLGPGDKIVVPVTVFAIKESVKKVDLSINTEGPLQINGESRQELIFDAPGEKDAAFSLSAPPTVGNASVTISAKSGKFKAHKKVDINIRPYSPRIYDSQVTECLPGQTQKIKIPDRGIAGTNSAVIRVMRKPKLNLDHRLGWLIRYPYGCIEQTVSAVFPQLYLKEFMKKSMDDERAIDTNIDDAIKRLRRFQLPSGAFAYWPGNKEASLWGTNYAGHFLVEAKKLGYNVPEDLLSGWQRFQESRSLMEGEHLMVRTYRLYVMAKADKPLMGAMNLLKENNLDKMPNACKWMLAAAYHMAGSPDAAKAIMQNAALEVENYRETGGTYGSRFRDTAIILEVLTLFQDWNKADGLYEEILDAISGDNWYSTQDLGFALMACGKYMKANSGDFRQEKSLLSGYIKLPGKKKVPFSTEGLRFSLPIEDGFGQDAEVHLDNKTTLKRAFAVMEWNGIPLAPNVKDESKNLWLQVEWLDENGMAIDPGQVKQGTTFWGHFRVGRVSYLQTSLEELALVQVLPSGWEIENIRLLKESVPNWMKNWNLNREEYVDIRDDRIMWFFDMYNTKNGYDFVVKINAVTAGEFILPPTIFEAMYDNKYKAVKKGRFVRVTSR